MLFTIPSHNKHNIIHIKKQFNKTTTHLINNISQLNKLQPITKNFTTTNIKTNKINPTKIKTQIKILHKILLTIIKNIHIILLHLTNQTQTLHYYTTNPNNLHIHITHKTLKLYSPLTNQLNI